MSSSFQTITARLVREVPEAEFRLDDALVAVSSLMTTIVTARRDADRVQPVKGQATIQRLAKAQMALIDASGGVLRVHGELADIARETAGLDLHECPAVAHADSAPQGGGAVAG